MLSPKYPQLPDHQVLPPARVLNKTLEENSGSRNHGWRNRNGPEDHSFIEISGSCWNYKIWASAGEKGRKHTSGLKIPFPPKVSKHIRLFGGCRGSDLQGQGQQQACCLSHWWDVTAITQSFQPLREAAWVWGEAHLLFWFQLPGRNEFPAAFIIRQEATKKQQ